MNTRGAQEGRGPTRRGLVLRGAALVALGGVPALAGRERAVAASRSWSRPVSGRHPVSAEYGARGAWQAGHHTGIDFALPTGTPVYSVGPGTVVFAGWSGSYGNAVTIRTDDDHYTVFAHLSEIRVGVGERVMPSTRVGSSGATGRVTGPHLHFEVRARRGYGTDVDPVAYLAERDVRLV